MIIEKQSYFDKLIETLNYENFIVFKHSRARIPESDLFGDLNMVQETLFEVKRRASEDDSLHGLVVLNRLIKIERMLELVAEPNDVCFTKFYSRNNKQFSYNGNYCELFIKMGEFISIHPKYNQDKEWLIGINPAEERTYVDSNA